MKIKKLEELSETIDYGYTASATNEEDGPKFLRITDIQNEKVDWNSVPYCNCSEKECIDYLLKKDDLVFARTGATTGKSFLIRDCPNKAIFASYLIRVRPNKEIVAPLYLSYFFKSVDYWGQVIEASNGSTQPGVNSTKLKQLKIPIPPLPEQKRIAAILDKADALRCKRQESIRLLDELLRSVFLVKVGPESKDYLNWEKVKIEDLTEKKQGSMRTGPFGSDLLHSEFVDKGVSVLGIDNAVNNKFSWSELRYITPEKYEKLKRYTVFSRDVIITIMGTTGRSAVIPHNIPLAISTKHLAVITLNRKLVNPYFLSYSIHSHPYVLNQILLCNKGAIMNGLNLTIIKELKIPLPPITLQNQFAQIVEKVEHQKQLLEKSLAEMENNFNSLMQRAFRGEL